MVTLSGLSSEELGPDLEAEDESSLFLKPLRWSRARTSRRTASAFDWTVSGSYRSELYLSPFNGKGFDSNGNQLFNDEVYIERTINGLFVNHDAIITLI